MTATIYGYYGKLPISPEFLRLHASGPEIRWLDEWLQRGTLYAKSQEGVRWEARIAEAGIYCFFYMPAYEGRVVSGALIASHDKAGRAFPFLSFALVDRDLFETSPWLIPVATARFLSETSVAIRKLRADLDWDAFRREVEQRQVESPDPGQAREELNQFVQSTTIGAWWEGVEAASDVSKQLAMVETLKQAAGDSSRRGVRFPLLSRGSSKNMDLSFWLLLCLQSMEGSWHPNTGVVCLWRREREDSDGTALLSIGPGPSNVVRFIVNSEAPDEAWSDITAESEIFVRDVRMPALSQCQDPQISLASFSELVCRVAWAKNDEHPGNTCGLTHE